VADSVDAQQFEFKTTHQLLHNQKALRLTGALLFKKGMIVTSMPYHLPKNCLAGFANRRVDEIGRREEYEYWAFSG
jgi:hypothetical protein